MTPLLTITVVKSKLKVSDTIVNEIKISMPQGIKVESQWGFTQKEIDAYLQSRTTV